MALTKQEIDLMVKDIVGAEVDEIRNQVLKNVEEDKKKFMAELIEKNRQLGMKDEKAQETGMAAARFVRALAAGRGNAMAGAEFAKRWGDEGLAKALGESTVAGGGALVPEEMAADVIELLRASTVVRRMGARSIPMPNGTLTLPRHTAGATGSYVGENSNITKEEQTFGNIVMSAKKLAVLTPISNELLNDASVSVDALVRDDLISAASTREDLAFIRGDGASNTPKGMLNWAVSGNKFNSAGTSLTQVTTDLTKAIRFLDESNVPLRRPGWVFTPRTKAFLMGIRDTNGNLAFQPEMAGGTLMGYPFMTTTQIPNTLGGGSNESEIYLAEFSSLMIGETGNMEVSVYDGAAYHDGSGVVSAVSQDQTVLRLIARHDFAPRQVGNEIVVIQQVTYGA